MKVAILVIGICSLAFTQTTRMDTSIGGKSVEKYHESTYDANQKLYLYSGGD